MKLDGKPRSGGEGFVGGLCMVRSEPTDCKYRGREPLNVLLCELCGQKDVLVNLFTCAVHGTCTLRKWTTNPRKRRLHKECLTCEDRKP